jgi:hypothetical protein
MRRDPLPDRGNPIIDQYLSLPQLSAGKRSARGQLVRRLALAVQTRVRRPHDSPFVQARSSRLLWKVRYANSLRKRVRARHY